MPKELIVGEEFHFTVADHEELIADHKAWCTKCVSTQDVDEHEGWTTWTWE